jgi:hypothetical protein
MQALQFVSYSRRSQEDYGQVDGLISGARTHIVAWIETSRSTTYSSTQSFEKMGYFMTLYRNAHWSDRLEDGYIRWFWFYLSIF